MTCFVSLSVLYYRIISSSYEAHSYFTLEFSFELTVELSTLKC